MKNYKQITIGVVIWILIGCTLSYSQDALDELKTQTPSKQNTSEQNPKILTPSSGIDEAKIKAIMAPDEFKHFEAAKAYIDQDSKYTLGADDVIEVIVMRHPEVSGQYLINKEGKIQYEFVGDLLVGGLTKDQVVNLLSKYLSEYIIKPEITVKIVGYNSKMVYVVGEVGAPGRIFMHGDTITVRDALLTAGLPLLTASTEKVSLFTPSETGQVSIKKVNVYALLYKGDLRENYVMKPGDTLYVPATFWAKAMRAINPVLNPIGQAAGTAGAGKAAL